MIDSRQPSKRARRGSWGRVAVAVVVFTVGAASFVKFVVMPVVVRWHPEMALRNAADAYARHDVTAFETAVDVRSVLADAIDQMTPAFLAGPLKSAELPDLVSEAEGLVRTGPLPAHRADTADIKTAPALPSVGGFLQEAARAPFQFDGLGPSQVDGDDARIEVRLLLNGRPMPLHIRLHWVGDHWQLAAVERIGETFGAPL